VAGDVGDGAVAPGRLRVLEHQLFPQARRLVVAALLLGDLGAVVQREVAQRMAGGEEWLEHLRRVGQTRGLEESPAVEVAEARRLVEVRVRVADRVELACERLPFPRPLQLDEVRRPLLDGELADLGRLRLAPRRAGQRRRLAPAQRGAPRGHGQPEREEDESDAAVD